LIPEAVRHPIQESTNSAGITHSDWNHAFGLESRIRTGITHSDWNHAFKLESRIQAGIIIAGTSKIAKQIIA
jgi:hypothetical protein